MEGKIGLKLYIREALVQVTDKRVDLELQCPSLLLENFPAILFKLATIVPT